jgi:hypothetical protein
MLRSVSLPPDPAALSSDLTTAQNPFDFSRNRFTLLLPTPLPNRAWLAIVTAIAAVELATVREANQQASFDTDPCLPPDR